MTSSTRSNPSSSPLSSAGAAGSSPRPARTSQSHIPDLGRIANYTYTCDASSRCAVEVQGEARLGSTEEVAGSIPADRFSSPRRRIPVLRHRTCTRGRAETPAGDDAAHSTPGGPRPHGVDLDGQHSRWRQPHADTLSSFSVAHHATACRAHNALWSPSPDEPRVLATPSVAGSLARLRVG